MKRVLIPVDFSIASVNALIYGIEMANHLKANVRVMHVNTGAHYAPSFAKERVEMQLIGQAQVWMEELMKEYSASYKVEGGNFDYKIREGNVVNEITNQAKYDDSSLIVVGSHGASGFESRIIGSNAYRLVSNSPCPVIVINKNMEWTGGIKSIVVPIDYSKSSRRKIPIVTGIAKLFNAKVYLVGLKESNILYILNKIGLFNKQVEGFIRKNAGVEVETTIISGKNLVEQLVDFSVQVDADLVTMHINHSPNPFIKLFKPFSNELINSSVKPVLAIPTKD